MIPATWRQRHDDFFRLSKPDWSHAELLEVAASTLAADEDGALERLRPQLRRLECLSSGYHETLTACWLDLVRLARHLEPAEMAARLAYSQLPLAFYSPDRLYSPEAAAVHLSPDLKPLELPRRLPDTEIERLVAFQSRTLSKPDWTHECHLRVALSVFLLLGEAGLSAMSRGIQRLNEVHEVPLTPSGGYHESLTRVWFTLVGQAARAAGLERQPQDLSLWELCLGWLQDKQLALRFYSRQRIMSWEARVGWLAPDLAELDTVDFV
ncbi:MAG: hypothetical protein U0931_30875 [Vulcanimicrobiota bacterium]